MFAVFRHTSDGCTWSAKDFMFVTEDEIVARDFVTMAELELEAAHAIMAKGGGMYKDAEQRCLAVLTLDPGVLELLYVASCYSYSPAEVR